MKIFLSGYYGFGNAGDEAVLAAMLAHLSERFNQPRFTVASGDPNATSQMHSSAAQKIYFLHGVQRDDFKAMAAEMKKTDLFISGGGSLLQDVTSLRNVAYHCGLLRLAQFKRKPSMMYAQGVGPLNQPLSQKLVRMATGKVRAITVRDNASKVLLQTIGVKSSIKVTADPVWGLETDVHESPVFRKETVWCVSVRSWPDVDEQDSRLRVAATLAALRDLAMRRGAILRFLPMQSKVDDKLLAALGVAPSEWIATAGVHPTRIMEHTANCDLMIAMRLHALIFAATQKLPCVAINYDPKVAALAEMLQIPILEGTESSQSDKLGAAIDKAKPPQMATLTALAEAAKRNAEIAAHCRK